MLARELKSKLKKEGTIAYFIVGQTFNGNSYTCQITKERFDALQNMLVELLPFLLADNLIPEKPFLENSIITGMKFNEIVNKEMELVRFVEPFNSFHVDDEENNGQIVQNRIPLKCIKRDVEHYPDQVRRLINNFQEWLGTIAELTLKSEYRQGNLFEGNKKENQEETTPDIDELNKATLEYLKEKQLVEVPVEIFKR